MQHYVHLLLPLLNLVVPAQKIVPTTPLDHERLLPPEPVPPKPPEVHRPEEHNIFEKPVYMPKPVSHSPKISPSSIPNPNPSVMTTKSVEPGYPNFGSYPYSVPGFSAFQPYPGLVQNQSPVRNEAPNTEFSPFPFVAKDSATFAPRDPSFSPGPNKEPFIPSKETSPFQSSIREPEQLSNTVKDANLSKPMARNANFTPASEPSHASADGDHAIFSPASAIPFSPKPATDTLPFSPKPPKDTFHFSPKSAKDSFSSVPAKDQHIPFPPMPTREPVRVSNLPVNDPKAFPTIQIKETTPFTQYSNKDPVPHSADTKDDNPFPSKSSKEFAAPLRKSLGEDFKMETDQMEDLTKRQTDFEEHFTPKIISAASIPEVTKVQNIDSKMSITSLSQGSGATVTIPSQISNKDVKKKPSERFSLKTSIPISKIDIKCMNTTSDTMYHNVMSRKTFNTPTPKETHKIEIQSNIVIKSAKKDPETKMEKINSTPPTPVVNPPITSSINTLIHAAEAINRTDSQFHVSEPKIDIAAEVKDMKPSLPTKPVYTPLNMDTNKVNCKQPSDGPYNEHKNQILFIQNKNSSNPKMLLTIQQQNPQVLLQRASFDPKNLQAPSRLSNQGKKSKEEIISECTSSKVVALKRLHQENCDENDFENLITENQIYGNKIVVKEKSQGVSQEQDLKTKKIEKTQTETKNVVIQPNIVYLSNVQFPANLMMIKNNSKITQTTDCIKTKVTSMENKLVHEVSTMTNHDNKLSNKMSQQNVAISKEIHVLNSSNMIQTLPNISKSDVIIQSNPKVIMNPQIVYQVPMIVESDKMSPPFLNRDYSKLMPQKKELPKQFEQKKTNEKLYIACPYQMDSKLQPKIVITNIRPKMAKVEEVSTLDLYEKRKRLKRLKYLTYRENKDVKDGKLECNKKIDRNDFHNVITPDRIKNEIIKEFANTKVRVDEGSSESESDLEEEDLKKYKEIIDQYGYSPANDKDKAQFLANFSLATLGAYKDKKMELQEKVLRDDAVATAYIAAGRLDILTNDPPMEALPTDDAVLAKTPPCHIRDETGVVLHRKQVFLSRLKLKPVSEKYKQGFEKVWQEILNERKRRSRGGTWDKPKQAKPTDAMIFDPNGQLQILTQIKKSVNENNNLIKMRLDSFNEADVNDESIRALADKNFSELSRLSKMADRSVKMLSGQDTRKRDLNPGFDSENIQKETSKLSIAYPTIKVPNITKIISLKSQPDCHAVKSTQATSMDEPRSSAAGVKEMFREVATTTKAAQRDFGCQAQEFPGWPGVKALLKSYKDFETARKRTIAELHRRNTALRVESSYITRGVSQDSDSARALLAERQSLAAEESRLRRSIQRICEAVDAIKNY